MLLVAFTVAGIIGLQFFVGTEIRFEYLLIAVALVVIFFDVDIVSSLLETRHSMDQSSAEELK